MMAGDGGMEMSAIGDSRIADGKGRGAKRVPGLEIDNRPGLKYSGGALRAERVKRCRYRTYSTATRTI